MIFILLVMRVSIHAPVRERHHGNALFSDKRVSIHAPVRERPIMLSTAATIASFNSRSRERAT